MSITKKDLKQTKKGARFEKYSYKKAYHDEYRHGWDQVRIKKTIKLNS